jgi:cobalt/nickel transport system ATP-binding protein
MRPELLILDEPFEGLDSRSRGELVTLLNKRNKEGMTIIMSTHDLNLVAAFADRVYVLATGRGVVTAGTPTDIFMQVEALKASNIDPPLLTELFLKMKDRGVVIEVPASMDQAVDNLVRLIKD